jgi:putative transposase
VGVTHVRRHYAHYHLKGSGHLYQGRFKSFPVKDDRHFLTLCRYVEANAARAGGVERAERWPWGGLYARERGGKPLILSAWPVDRPAHWDKLVNKPMEEEELERVRTSVRRGLPLGDEQWVDRIARRLGLQFTLRDVGRPKKPKNK